MIETITIKSEPISEEEVEEVLPDPLELPIQVKPDVIRKGKLGSNSNGNQGNSEVKNNNSSVLPDKTLVNLNGVLYLLEKIPDTVEQKNQTQKAVVHDTSTNPLDDPAPCPHCGKILKRRRNLKLHIQVCSNNISYSCELCPYQTFNEALFTYHVRTCKKGNVSHQPLIDPNKDLFSRICPECYITMPLETKVCDQCGSLNRWQCKNCNKYFENYSQVRHHYKTICKPGKFYHCKKCDYRSALNKRVSTHIRRCHPELNSSKTFEHIRKVKASIGANGVEHLCSKCGTKFDEPEKLNRHRYRCKETTSKKQNEKHTVKIENSDSSQIDSNIELTRFNQFIVLHCQTCDKDIESEESSCVAPQKLCTTCSSTLAHKCTKCDMLHEDYNVILSHVNNICNRPRFKCDDDASATCTNCGEYFTNSTLFMWHVENCGVSCVFKCDKCTYTTFKKTYLLRHMSSFHGQSNAPNSNSIANRNFSAIPPRIQSFCVNCERRQQTHDQTKFCKICRSKLQFRCAACSKMYSIDNPDACEHVKAHSKRLRLECQRCGRKFPKKSKEYQLHVESCGKVRRYSCELCSYSTRFANHLPKHKQEEHNISNADAMANSKGVRSSQTTKRMADDHKHVSNKSEAGKTALKVKNRLEIDEDSNALLCQDSRKEAENSNSISYKNDSENKLNLQCKVVLTRLNM